MYKQVLKSFVLGLMLVALVGCDSDSNGGSDDELVIAGVRVLDASTQQEAIVIANGEVTGSIELVPGAATDRFTLEFRDEDWRRVRDFELGEEYTLQLSTTNLNIAQVVVVADERWDFFVSGVGPGETELNLILKRNGQDDFVVPQIPIRVINE